jgi:hypothetical protein
VLIIRTLSMSGLTDEGFSWQINKPALQGLPPYFLVGVNQLLRMSFPRA